MEIRKKSEKKSYHELPIKFKTIFMVVYEWRNCSKPDNDELTDKMIHTFIMTLCNIFTIFNNHLQYVDLFYQMFEILVINFSHETP